MTLILYIYALCMWVTGTTQVMSDIITSYIHVCMDTHVATLYYASKLSCFGLKLGVAHKCRLCNTIQGSISC